MNWFQEQQARRCGLDAMYSPHSIEKSELDELCVIYNDKGEVIEKSFSSDLKDKFPDSVWRTINGSHVLIHNGKVVAGLAGFNGKIDQFFAEKKEKEEGGKEESKDKEKNKSANQIEGSSDGEYGLSKMKNSPLKKEFLSLKKQYPDAIVLLEINGFYETMGDDAKTISNILGIPLTNHKSNGGINLAGFKKDDEKIKQLIKEGYRIAVKNDVSSKQENQDLVGNEKLHKEIEDKISSITNKEDLIKYGKELTDKHEVLTRKVKNLLQDKLESFGKEEKKDIKAPEGYNEKVWDWAVSEAKRDKKWAEDKNKELGGKEWKEASKVSQDMLKERLEKPVEQLAKEHYDYLKLRSHATGKIYGQSEPIDKPAFEKWKELTGEEPKKQSSTLNGSQEAKKEKQPSYKEAIKIPKGGAVAMDDNNLQAQAAQIIANKHAMNPETVYNWANKHGVNLKKEGFILSDIKHNSAFMSDILNDKYEDTKKIIEGRRKSSSNVLRSHPDTDKKLADLTKTKIDNKILENAGLKKLKEEFYDKNKERIKFGGITYGNDKYGLQIKEGTSYEDKPKFEISLWENTNKKADSTFNLTGSTRENLYDKPYETAFGEEELNQKLQDAVKLLKQSKK